MDAVSPLAEELGGFHDGIIIMIITIGSIVLWFLVRSVSSAVNLFLVEGSLIERVWTFLPAVGLFFVATPSLHLLYLLEEANESSLLVEVSGHQ